MCGKFHTPCKWCESGKFTILSQFGIDVSSEDLLRCRRPGTLDGKLVSEGSCWLSNHFVDWAIGLGLQAKGAIDKHSSRIAHCVTTSDGIKVRICSTDVSKKLSMDNELTWMRGWFRQKIDITEQELWLPAHIHAGEEQTARGDGVHFVWTRLDWTSHEIHIRDSMTRSYQSVTAWLANRMRSLATRIESDQKKDSRAWEVKTDQVIQQDDGYECGAHVISGMWSKIFGTLHNANSVKKIRNILILFALAQRDCGFHLQIALGEEQGCAGEQFLPTISEKAQKGVGKKIIMQGPKQSISPSIKQTQPKLWPHQHQKAVAPIDNGPGRPQPIEHIHWNKEALTASKNKLCSLNIGPVGFNVKGQWCLEEILLSKPAIVALQDLKRNNSNYHIHIIRKAVLRIAPHYKVFLELSGCRETGPGVMLVVHERMAVLASKCVLLWIAKDLTQAEQKALQGRFLMVQLLDPAGLPSFVASVYMPTSDKQKERTAFFAGLKKVVDNTCKKHPKSSITLAGDWNAVLTKSQRVGYAPTSSTRKTDEEFSNFVKEMNFQQDLNSTPTWSSQQGNQQAVLDHVFHVGNNVCPQQVELLHPEMPSLDHRELWTKVQGSGQPSLKPPKGPTLS